MLQKTPITGLPYGLHFFPLFHVTYHFLIYHIIYLFIKSILKNIIENLPLLHKEKIGLMTTETYPLCSLKNPKNQRSTWHVLSAHYIFVLESPLWIPSYETCGLLTGVFFPPFFSLFGEKYREDIKLNYHTSEQEALHPVPEDKYQNNKSANNGQKIIVRTLVQKPCLLPTEGRNRYR